MAAGGGQAAIGPAGIASGPEPLRRWREAAAGTEAAAGVAAGASAEAAAAEEEVPLEAAAGNREAAAPGPARRLKMTVIQKPLEKKTMNREIILEERSSLTGIDIKILKKKSIMKVENHRGGQISVSS